MKTEKITVCKEFYYTCSQRMPMSIKKDICHVMDKKVMPFIAHEAVHYGHPCATYMAQMICLQLMRALNRRNYNVIMAEGVFINDGKERSSDPYVLFDQLKTYHTWLLIENEYLIDAGAASLKLGTLPELAYMTCCAWDYSMQPLRSIKRVLPPPDGMPGCIEKYFISQNVPAEAMNIVDMYSGFADVVSDRFSDIEKAQAALWIIAKALDDANIPHRVAVAKRSKTEKTTSRGKWVGIIDFGNGGVIEPYYSSTNQDVCYSVEDIWDNADDMIDDLCMDPAQFWGTVNDDEAFIHPCYMEPMRKNIMDCIYMDTRMTFDSEESIKNTKVNAANAAKTLARYLEYEYGQKITSETKPKMHKIDQKSTLWSCSWNIADSKLTCDFELTKVGPVIHKLFDETDQEMIIPPMPLRHPLLTFAESCSRIYDN